MDTENITKEQRQKYQQIRDDFHKSLDAKRKLIQDKKQVINQLEKSIQNERPKIEGCNSSLLCKTCDIYSMMPDGESQGQDYRRHHYKCVICYSMDFTT